MMHRFQPGRPRGGFPLLITLSLALGGAHGAFAQAVDGLPLPPPASSPATGTAPATAIPQSTDPFWLRVTGDSVNLRSRADINSHPVAQVNRGTYLQAVGVEGTWYRIVPPKGVFSVVAAQYVRELNPSEAEVNVSSGVLRVRVGSRVQELDPLRAEVQTTLERGDRVKILERVGEWLRIEPPSGVHVFVATDLTQRVDAAEALASLSQEGAPVQYADEARVADGVPPAAPGGVITSTIPAAAPASSPAGDSGVRPVLDMTGVWGRKLTEIEAQIEAEKTRPILERNLESQLEALRPIAEQREETMIAQRANAWVNILQERLQAQNMVRQARELSDQQARHAARVKQEAQRPAEPVRFDAVGQLTPSFLLESGAAGLRFRIQDPLTGRVLAYAEFPPDTRINFKDAVGKYVGVRGQRFTEPKYEVGIIRVEAMTVLTTEPSRPVERPTR